MFITIKSDQSDSRIPVEVVLTENRHLKNTCTLLQKPAAGQSTSHWNCSASITLNACFCQVYTRNLMNSSWPHEQTKICGDMHLAKTVGSSIFCGLADNEINFSDVTSSMTWSWHFSGFVLNNAEPFPALKKHQHWHFPYLEDIQPLQNVLSPKLLKTSHQTCSVTKQKQTNKKNTQEPHQQLLGLERGKSGQASQKLSLSFSRSHDGSASQFQDGTSRGLVGLDLGGPVALYAGRRKLVNTDHRWRYSSLRSSTSNMRVALGGIVSMSRKWGECIIWTLAHAHKHTTINNTHTRYCSVCIQK